VILSLIRIDHSSKLERLYPNKISGINKNPTQNTDWHGSIFGNHTTSPVIGTDEINAI